MCIRILICIFKKQKPRKSAKRPKNGVFFLSSMIKIRRISDFQHQFSFLDQHEHFEVFYERFLESDLGKIFMAIPWDGLVKKFRLKDCKKGPTSIFSPRGKLALMLLKHYASCSDRRLIEQLNGNYEYQFFCDIYLGSERIENYKIVSEIRCELAVKLDIEKIQQELYNYWSGHIQDSHSLTIDATCYESELRYPSSQKLLWECVDWTYQQLREQCKSQKVPLPRTKYNKWRVRYISYSKMRKKTIKKRKALTRSQLMLLDKLNKELDRVEKLNEDPFLATYYRRRSTIKKIYHQQYQLFTFGKTPKDRIVSIGKDYLRPIVRGKEIKAVEFGAKVNKYQIDGINFIEHISFDAFHEGIRFKDTIFKAQKMTRTKTKIAGADSIYATNVNRRFCTQNNIRTDFKRKGRASTKHEPHRKQLSEMITKERASRLEGSFGKEKEHYHLKKVKARTEATEILWIFFGIHTANALEIGRRMYHDRQRLAA